MHRDSLLQYVPPAFNVDSLFIANTYRDTTYTFDHGFIEGFETSRFNSLLPQVSFAFTSQPLPEDIFWIGTPTMKLFVQSNYEKFPLHVQIYEVDSTGTKYFVNRINYTARNWKPGSLGTIEAEGIAHAHKFLRSNRIRIEVTNMDKTNRQLRGTFPFVVPMFKDVSATLFFGSESPSYVELPVIGNPTAVEWIPADIPTSFQMFQNYPNPFNPITTIAYEIPRPSYVVIKVYNTLGQEVKEMVNGFNKSGRHTVTWNADNTTSGVYYYRIVAQEFGIGRTFSEVKKAVLLK
ncbi:MAG TPA: T9SS type A sorting domain-containing protein [Bacteroidota bacterium]|nr:T9SS type A sorting domain-containing protein [Bacteroidota bacterium]